MAQQADARVEEAGEGMTVFLFGQVDAEEAGQDWAIVCPGPSLDEFDVASIAGLPTIAVGGAAAHPELDYRWWANWDDPHRGHWDSIERARELQPAILTRWQAGDTWEGYAAENFVEHGNPIDAVVIVQHPKHDRIPLPWHEARLDRAPSWLLAMRFAMWRGGAKQIRMVGLDLAGVGYALEREDHRMRSPEEWNGRWEGERRMYRAAVALALSEGVEVAQS